MKSFLKNKIYLILFFYIILCNPVIFSMNIRNLQVIPQTVSPGENITIIFEYYVSDWGKGSYYAQISDQCNLRNAGTTGQDILVSEDGINMLTISVDGGRQGNQKQTGGWFPSGDIDANIYMTVPENYTSGIYYVVVAVRDWNIWCNPNPSYDHYACISFTVAAKVTATLTPTITLTEAITITSTITETPTHDNADISTG